MLSKVFKKIYKLYLHIRTFWFMRAFNKAKLCCGINKSADRKEHVVVSLTSYKERYQNLPITLKSILIQTYKPDKIIVWLDDDIPENQPTDEMRKLEEYGITYRFTYCHLKPHNKYIHAMREFPGSIIITVDDDVIYGNKLIEKLMENHKKYPKAVCAVRTHKITWDKNNNIMPYNNWDWECISINKPSLNLLATGVCGCLYPPGILPEETYNEDKIRKYCLMADDIWLKFMELSRNIPVVRTKYFYPSIIKDSQVKSLNSDNVHKGKNDIYIKNMIKLYPSAYQTLVDNKKG